MVSFKMPITKGGNTMGNSIDERVKRLCVPASSAKGKRCVVGVITRADIDKLNQAIEPKIQQNAQERRASAQCARDTIVGAG